MIIMINTDKPLSTLLTVATLSLLNCNSANSSESDSTILDKTSLNIAASQPKLDGYSAEDENLFGSALSYALLTNNSDAAGQLIKAGADVNTVNPINETPLEQAINGDSVLLVQLLLQYGARPNYLQEPVSCNTLLATASGGNSLFYQMPLDQAYKKGNSDIIHLLEQAGAKSTSTCSQKN
jgi:ankyrin repeat protein